MSHSFHSADRGTHSKVIAVALALSVVVGLVGLFGRADNNVLVSNGTGVIKAPKSIITTNDESRLIR
jgi:hypothetical protein